MSSKPTQDPWFQLFAFTALVSGALTAHAYSGFRSSQGPAAAAPVAPQAPALSLGSSSPAPLPPLGTGTSPMLSGSGVRKLLTPKAPGRWVVDAKNGADSDTDNLADAVFSAADKDVLTLRPGVYKAPIALAKKDLVIEGAGTDESVIESLQFNAVTVNGGELTLKNLSVVHQGPDYGSALEVRQAKIVLERVKVTVKGKSTGLSVNQGVVAASDIVFENGDPNLRAEDGSDVKCARCSFSGSKTGMRGDGRGTRVELVEGKVSSEDIAAHFWGESELAAKGTTFENSETAIMASKKARVTLTDARLLGNETGVSAGGAGVTVTLVNLTALKNKRVLQLWDEAQGLVQGCVLEDQSEGASVSNKNSKLVVTGCKLARSERGFRSSNLARLEVADTTVTDTQQYAFTIDENAAAELRRVKITATTGTGVYVFKRAQVTLENVEIRKSGESGVFIGEDSRVIIRDALVEGSSKFGVTLDRDAKLDAVDLKSRDNRRCGLAIAAETAEIKLKRSFLNRNECGIAFYVGGLVDSENGDFTGNEKGAFMYKPENKAKITLRGPNNKSK